jgi:predicted SnoaL-like aldol condensation-catalyzing enzyme
MPVLQKMLWKILLMLTTLFFPLVGVASNSQAEANKKIVTSFYETAFNQHKPTEAMDKYVGDKYIQHNPFVANGKKPFIDFFLGFYKEHPTAQTEIKRVLADGDLVVVHTHSQIDKNDRGRAVMDIFRLEKRKIVEHWDVSQSIPEKIANANTMF